MGFVVWGVGYTGYHVGWLALRCPLLVTALIVLALAFDFINGIHDAANSIATIVSTRVLTPLQAVVWAAFFNFVAAWVFGIHVAMTIGKGIIHPDVADSYVILGGLMGAVLWNLTTWYLGLPTSSSHALIGGLAGAAVAKAGVGAVIASGMLKVAALHRALAGDRAGARPFDWLRHDLALPQHQARQNRYPLPQGATLLRRALQPGPRHERRPEDHGHHRPVALHRHRGSGRARASTDFPFWIVLICNTAMGLGTLIGGWRIVKTMGSKITRLNPFGGFCAESAAAATLFATAAAGIPVSTTHTITGSIVGYGAMRRLSAVRWGVAGRIVWAWILTIPVAGSIGALVYLVAAALFGARG